MQWSSHDQRDAKLLQKCPFPNKRVISLAHDETHPSVATTWARVTRAIGLPPGESGAKLRAEVKAYCDTCLVCAKLKPARDKLESRLGSIRKRPFGQYAFDVMVLSEPACWAAQRRHCFGSGKEGHGDKLTECRYFSPAGFHAPDINICGAFPA